MVQAEYFTNLRYPAEIDPEEYWRPWHQALPQIKGLVTFCILSAVVAVGYPEFFADIFGRW